MMSANMRAGGIVNTRHSPGLVIFTRVEGLIREQGGGLCQLSRDAFRLMGSLDVPLILVGDSTAEDTRELQVDLELAAPFICERGAALHVPASYFCHEDLWRAGEETWEVFRFNPPDPSAAIRLLAALFVGCGDRDVLTIGLGCDDRDYPLLAAVDVPIVVRDDGKDQRGLLREVPGAYVTHASGAAGWFEALLGAPSH